MLVSPLFDAFDRVTLFSFYRSVFLGKIFSVVDTIPSSIAGVTKGRHLVKFGKDWVFERGNFSCRDTIYRRNIALTGELLIILLRVFCVCLALVSVSQSVYAEDLVVYADHAYPPIVYLDDGKPSGILPELFARLERDTGDTYKMVLVPFRRALIESQRGNGGVVNISWNDGRAAIYDFSLPIYYEKVNLAVLKGNEFPFKEPSDLKGKRVGKLYGGSFGAEVDKALAAASIVFDEDVSPQSRMKKLLAGRMDVAIIGGSAESIRQMFAADHDLAGKWGMITLLPTPLTFDPRHLAFAKTANMKPALERFNKALTALIKTHEYRQFLGN